MIQRHRFPLGIMRLCVRWSVAYALSAPIRLAKPVGPATGDCDRLRTRARQTTVM
jgi:hypothetical protein